MENGNNTSTLEIKNMSHFHSAIDGDAKRAALRIKRRNNNKSLSIRRKWDRDSKEKIPNLFMNPLMTSDSPVKNVPFSNDGSSLGDSPQMDLSSQRPNSIEKKSLLNRRNILHLYSTREKNTYSANTNLLERSIKMDKLKKGIINESDIYGSGIKFQSNKLNSTIQKRRHIKVKPFCLFPVHRKNLSNKDITRNISKPEDFSLPEIYLKDTLLPSTNESDLSLFDDAYSSQSSDEYIDNQNKSSFLTKMEKL